MSYVRRASHSARDGFGWYDGDATRLKSLVDQFFRAVQCNPEIRLQDVVGVISPHAGISYSGETAAKVYQYIRHLLYQTERGGEVKRIFIVGPSHHKGFAGVEVSGATTYSTPFGDIPIDRDAAEQVSSALSSAGVAVGTMSRKTDEDEHSIEMQLPFLSHILHFSPDGTTLGPAVKRVKLVPLLIGWCEREEEEAIGKVLASALGSGENLFVLSSDFCHWGSRFQYMYHYEKAKYPAIGDAIIAMDHEGMRLLGKRNRDAWYAYLDTTNNTICGRHPISIGMAALQECGRSSSSAATGVNFVGYAQSNKCQSTSDSSVSYAAGLLTLANQT